MKQGTVAFAVTKQVLWIFVKGLCATLRMQRINDAPLRAALNEGNQIIIAFWHGEMLAGWYAHRPLGEKPITALISQSSDGELLAVTLEHLGFTVVRGSSHRGGTEAMQLMEETIRGGSSLCITPDGPTGPRHEMKMGAVRLAQKTGAQLFLVGIAAAKKKNLKSWDSFTIPRPFSRVCLCCSNRIPVPAEGLLDEVRTMAEEELRTLTELAAQKVAEVS
jgi:hypothetical protein